MGLMSGITGCKEHGKFNCPECRRPRCSVCGELGNKYCTPWYEKRFCSSKCLLEAEKRESEERAG